MNTISLETALPVATAATTLAWWYSIQEELSCTPAMALAAIVCSFAWAGAAFARASSSLNSMESRNMMSLPVSAPMGGYAKFASGPSPYSAFGVQRTDVVGRRNGVASLQAKKGKPNVPIQNRGAYVAQQKMREQLSAMQPDDNGFPRFDLFVKGEKSPMWYPCGSFGGDERAKALVESWMSNPLGMGGMVKGQIDRSVAASLFNNGGQVQSLKQQVTKMYPALKNSKNNLKFGYKITFDGLEEKQGVQKVTQVTEDMKESPVNSAVDKVKNMFGVGGGGDE